MTWLIVVYVAFKAIVDTVALEWVENHKKLHCWSAAWSIGTFSKSKKLENDKRVITKMTKNDKNENEKRVGWVMESWQIFARSPPTAKYAFFIMKILNFLIFKENIDGENICNYFQLTSKTICSLFSFFTIKIFVWKLWICRDFCCKYFLLKSVNICSAALLDMQYNHWHQRCM